MKQEHLVLERSARLNLDPKSWIEKKEMFLKRKRYLVEEVTGKTWDGVGWRGMSGVGVREGVKMWGREGHGVKNGEI